MSNKMTLYMTGLVVIAVAIILALNLTEIFSQKNEKYIAFNDVRGMAIEHNELLWTLNFDQQNKVIEYLNLSLPVGTYSGYNKSGLNFTKMIIYRFNAPDIILTPIAYDNGDLIFSVPEWNREGYMKDVSLGRFKDLIAETYDH